MSASIKLKDLSIKNSEAIFLLELSPEINNFKPTFKGDLHNTYILSPYGSSMFGFDISNNEPYLGVPEKLFFIMLDMGLEGLFLEYNKPGIYLLFNLGEGVKKRRVAIRIFLRRRRVNALYEYPSIVIAPMNIDGALSGAAEPFSLDVFKDGCLQWEHDS